MRKLLAALVFVLGIVCFCSSAAANEAVYIVKSGDNLWQIAKDYGTSVDKLTNWNNLGSDALQIGDRLLIQAPNSSQQVQAAAVAPAPAKSGQVIYIVKANDNLWDISQAYNITVEDLMVANSLADDSLSIGDQLTIPGSVAAGPVNPSRGGGRTSSNEIAAAVIKTAESYLGTPYKYGGQGPGGFDCSGFAKYVFSQHGYDLPRVASSQASLGVHVDKDKLVAGDLVFFAGGKNGIDHVGIYAGGGQFIHSSSPSSGGVIYTSLSETYYSRSYVGARRIL